MLALFTLCRIDLMPARKTRRTELLFAHKKLPIWVNDFGKINHSRIKHVFNEKKENPFSYSEWLTSSPLGGCLLASRTSANIKEVKRELKNTLHFKGNTLVWRGGGGDLNKYFCWGLCPEVQPLHLYIQFLTEKKMYLYVYLLLNRLLNINK